MLGRLSDSDGTKRKQLAAGNQTMTRNTTRTNDAALAAFIAKKAEIDAMLARLQAFSDDHFGADPERVNWSDLGSLEYQAHLLKQISDFTFGEGEHAA